MTSSDSTDKVSTNDYCGDDAEGFVETCVANGFRYIISSGAPNHPAEYDQEKANPNIRCKAKLLMFYRDFIYEIS